MREATAPALTPDADDSIRLNGAGPHPEESNGVGAQALRPAERQHANDARRAVEARIAAKLRAGGGSEPEIANDEPAQPDPRHDDALGLLRLYHQAAEGVDGVLVLGTVNPAEEKPEEKKRAPYRTTLQDRRC